MSEKGGRMRLLHIGLASPVMAMEGFLEKHRTWIEAVVGCATAETITLECNFPFSHLVLEQMLAEVNLDRQCLGSAETLRPLVRHWETPPECGYNWDSVLLDPSLNEMVRDDYETFWDSEAWFHSRNLPYKRGFLLYGPPGNGKTTAARIMACHPQVSAFSIELKEQLPNEALSDLFQAAEDRAPALIILEDLDRTFGSLAEAKR